MKYSIITDLFNRFFNSKNNENIQEIKENLINRNKFNPNCKVVNGPDRPGDIRDSLANIELTEQLLGYNEPIYFKDGMEIYCDWLEQSDNL